MIERVTKRDTKPLPATKTSSHELPSEPFNEGNTKNGRNRFIYDKNKKGGGTNEKEKRSYKKKGK